MKMSVYISTKDRQLIDEAIKLHDMRPSFSQFVVGCALEAARKLIATRTVTSEFVGEGSDVLLESAVVGSHICPWCGEHVVVGHQLPGGWECRDSVCGANGVRTNRTLEQL